MFKKWILFLIISLFLNIEISYADLVIEEPSPSTCLILPMQLQEDELQKIIQELANKIWDTFSRTSSSKPTVLENVLSALNNYEFKEQYAPLSPYKNEIAAEILILYEQSKSPNLERLIAILEAKKELGSIKWGFSQLSITEISRILQGIEEIKDPLLEFSPSDKINAISKAYDDTLNFGNDQSKKLSTKVVFLLAPHGDYAHFNRLEIVTSENWEEFGCFDMSCVIESREKANAESLPIDTDVGIDERSIVTVANLHGRSSIEGKFPILKHFPGGPVEVELTEKNIFVIPAEFDGLVKMEETYLKPFIEALKLKNTNKFGIMVSHGFYPQLEKDLKSLYPDTPMFIDGLENLPASLNPYIVKGLLKERYGFDGYIVADWYDMESVDKSIEILYKTHPELIDYTYDTTIFILAVYAGVHFIPSTNPDIGKITELYNTNQEFKSLLDDLVYEKIVLLSKLFSYGEVGSKEEVLKNFNIEDKFFLLEGYQIGSQKVYGKPIYDFDRINRIYPFLIQSKYENHQDVLDRSNALHNRFRRKILAELYKQPSFYNDRLNPSTSASKKYLELNNQIQNVNGWENLAQYYELVINQKTGFGQSDEFIANIGKITGT